MPGAPDPEYILVRKVLLDALEALGDQRNAVVLVGAQAIYLHTSDADLAVAPYTLLRVRLGKSLRPHIKASKA